MSSHRPDLHQIQLSTVSTTLTKNRLEILLETDNVVPVECNISSTLSNAISYCKIIGQRMRDLG